MGLVIVPDLPLAQPRGIAEFNRQDPLGRCLDSAWLGSDLSGKAVGGGLIIAPTAGSALKATTRGLAIANTGTVGTMVAVPAITEFPYVQAGLGYFDGSAASYVLSQLDTAAGGYASRIAISTSTAVALTLRYNFGTTRTLTVTTGSGTNAGLLICAIAVFYSETDYRLFVNGQQANGTLSPGALGSLNRVMPPGGTLNGGLYFTGFGSGRAISDVDALRITENPDLIWGMFEPQPSRRASGFSAAGANNTVAPGSGHLTASGKQPTVTRTAHQSVAAATGHLTASGKQPTVSATAGTTLAPTAGHALLTGRQPTVTRIANQTIAAAAGHLTATGRQPTVSQSAGTTLAPSVGNAALTGRQPTVTRTANQSVAASAGHLAASGRQPSVSQTAGTTLAPSAGHAALTGRQPTVTRTANQAVAASAGHLAATGRQPNVSQSGPIVISPSTWHAIFAGHVPTVTQASNQTAQFWDDPDEFYDVGPYGFATEVLLGQTTFAGLFDSSDATAWDHAGISTHKLRCRQSETLADGDLLTIQGHVYRVLGTPQRLNTAEKIAHLVMQS
jgi:hypothetical protein